MRKIYFKSLCLLVTYAIIIIGAIIYQPKALGENNMTTIQAIVAEWQAVLQSIESYKAEIASANALITDLKNQLNQSNLSVKEREDRINHLENQIAGLNIQISNLKVQVADLEAKLVATQPPAPTPKLLWSDDFTTMPKEAPDQYVIDAPDISMIKLGSFNNQPALRIDLSYDQILNHAGKCKTELGPRAIFSPETLRRYSRLAFRKKFAVGLTICIPTDWQRDGSRCSVMSFHGSEDPGEEGIGRNGCLGIHIGGDKFYAWRCWSKTKIQTGNENRLEITLAIPYVRGTAYRLVWEGIFDWLPQAEGGIGYSKIWINDVLMFDEVGPNAFNDDEPPYFKFGAYEASWGEPDRTRNPDRPIPSKHTVYFQKLRFGYSAEDVK